MLTCLVHPCATTRLWNLWSKKPSLDISLRSHHLAALEPSTCLARVGKTAPATGELGLWGPGLNKVGAAPWLKAGKHGKTGAKPLAKPFLVLKDLESWWWVKCTAHFQCIFTSGTYRQKDIQAQHLSRWWTCGAPSGPGRTSRKNIVTWAVFAFARIKVMIPGAVLPRVSS